MTEVPESSHRSTQEKVLFGLAKFAAIFLFLSGALVTEQTYQNNGDMPHLIVAALTTIASLILVIVVFRHDASRRRGIRNAPRNTR